ncbi:hypothetical protein ABPG72_002587 [Tetrahymena utriculariae]
MDQQKMRDMIIMNNILFLVKQSKKSILSQRNLLNKWFQDSIKSYILEQITFPFFGKQLNCKTSIELRAFMSLKQAANIKPKYMEIIEQYFYYINEFNLGDVFMQKLNIIIQNPSDVTQQSNYHSYNIQKMVRKQFVCLLLLRFFQFGFQQDFNSFYDLWNFSFPEVVQTKKKLSKYDTKMNKKQQCPLSENSTKNSCSPSLPTQLISDMSFSSHYSPNINNQQPSSDLNSLVTNNLHQNNVQLQEKVTQQNKNGSSSFQKQQINSGILEEDDDEEEEYINLSHQLSYQQEEPLCKKEEEPSQSEKICQDNYLQQKIKQNQQSSCTQQDQNHIYYQMQYCYYLPAQQIPNQFYNSQCKIEIKQEELNQPIFYQN